MNYERRGGASNTESEGNSTVYGWLGRFRFRCTSARKTGNSIREATDTTMLPRPIANPTDAAPGRLPSPPPPARSIATSMPGGRRIPPPPPPGTTALVSCRNPSGGKIARSFASPRQISFSFRSTSSRNGQMVARCCFPAMYCGRERNGDVKLQTER
jgi:hypothetical protein